MPLRILIVDDEAHILQVLSLKLRNAGYEVLTAADGEEGLEFALREKPDLVITDFQMPYMTGLEMCKAMNQQERTKEIPVVMLTARGYALENDDLAASNIKEVLSKPFSPRSVLQLVERLLAARNNSAGKARNQAA